MSAQGQGQIILTRSEADQARATELFPQLAVQYVNGAGDWAQFDGRHVVMVGEDNAAEVAAHAETLKILPAFPDDLTTDNALAWAKSVARIYVASDQPPPPASSPEPESPARASQAGGDPIPDAPTSVTLNAEEAALVASRLNDLLRLKALQKRQEELDAAIAQQEAERGPLTILEPAEAPKMALFEGLPDALSDEEHDEALAADEALSSVFKAAAAQQTHIKESRGKPLDWAKLATAGDPPPRQWAIKGWLGFGHVTLLVGQGGIGKTLIAQQLASCLALGKGFIEDATSEQRILMWACEDDHDELWRRQVNICKWLGVPMDEFGHNLVIEPRAGLENALVVSDFGKPAFTPLITTLEEQAADLKAGIVILDNVAQLFGAGENDRHAVTVFLNALVGALPGRAILLLGHPSRGQGSEFSGSSAWENCARTRLYLGRELPDSKTTDERAEDTPDDATRFLCRRKANYSSRDYRRLTYRDGVLQADETDAGPVINVVKQRQVERIILEGLGKLLTMGLQPSEASTTPRYLPKMLADYKLAEACSKKDLADTMRRLMLDGKIAKVKIGKQANGAAQFGLTLTGQSVSAAETQSPS